MAQEKEVLLIDNKGVGDTATGVEVRVSGAEETVSRKAQQEPRYCSISIMQQQQQQPQM